MAKFCIKVDDEVKKYDLEKIDAIEDKVETVEDNLGSPSSASGVTGADAFTKINSLNSDLTSNRDTTSLSSAIFEYNAKEVVLHLNGASVTSGWVGGSAFRIPAALRPKNFVIAAAFIETSNSQKGMGYFSSDTPGAIAARDASGNAFSGIIYGTLTWLL